MNKQSAKMIDDVGKRDFFIDDASIEKYSKALVAEVLSPSRLIEFVMDHVQPINSDEPQSLIALRTAIDSRYPELRSAIKPVTATMKRF